jgi:GNAT superfamily N-acetyltransferase
MIVKLLADDPLGARRENYAEPLPQSYYDACAAIDADPPQELMVVESSVGAVIGVLQLTFIPYLTYRAGGIGRRLFEWALKRARARGCHRVQLTSDKARPDAIRFCEALGFVASHEGMKLHLRG